ncbi:hypothetical protein [Nesterenkonia flava]|uniref:Lysophospholipase n=1 Tax=Nesterenkonia flava TaxID=469799 RepID=A0ABU1FU18_9MICC|nr:hypothetical protein [Nesterenkonia flava]MDR5712141.1 hypothetical protein [Nesterenkonia flava]
MTETVQEAPETETVHPPGTVRGHAVVFQGRGDSPAHYRRLSARLAVDGYTAHVPTTAPRSPQEAADLWNRLATGWAPELSTVAIGADTAAGFLAEADQQKLLSPAPGGLVLAGAAVAGATPSAEDELTLRSACPVHRGVAEEAGAESIRTSSILPTWSINAPSIPVLAIHGEADRISPLPEVQHQLHGWSAELTTVAGGLHDVLNDVHHRSVAAEIITFVERLRLDPTATPILRRKVIA